MKETRFNIGMNTLKQIDGLHGEEVYNTIQEISPAIADYWSSCSATSTRAPTWISRNGN